MSLQSQWAVASQYFLTDWEAPLASNAHSPVQGSHSSFSVDGHIGEDHMKVMVVGVC